MKDSIRSHFDTLRADDEPLWRLGALAERYFAEDPNTSLLKLRQLSELLAQSLAARTFYAQGVKTNVLFFTRGKKDTGNTKQVWVYDMRANMPQFGKRTPFTRDYFRTAADAAPDAPRDKFEDVFGTDPCGGPAALARRVDTGEAGRWRVFSREQIQARGDNLDISWLKDESAESAEAQRDEPALVARLVMRELTGALADLRSLLEDLGEDPDVALDDLLIDEQSEGAQP